MHIAIDVLACIFLLFFFLAGWRKGFLLSMLGVFRLILSYVSAYFVGRHVGFWLGAVTHRPRIITIPIMSILGFAFVYFGFHILMLRIQHKHAENQAAEDRRSSTKQTAEERKTNEGVHHSIPSHLFGGLLNFLVGLPSILILFWLTELLLMGIANTPIPGAEKSYLGQAAHRAAERASLFLLPDTLESDQAEALAKTFSNPTKGMREVESLFQTGPFVLIRNDGQVLADVMSGDPEIIKQNAAIQNLLSDRMTLVQMREIGILSSKETKESLCKKLAAWGRNKRIRTSFESLQQREMLDSRKVMLLLRDPDFDIIVAELVHPSPDAIAPPETP
jgi:hypothetical protein